MQGLLRRLYSAIIFVIIMLAGLFGGPYSFVALFAIISGVCVWEYLSLVLTKDHRRDKIRKLLGLAIGVMPVIIGALLKLEIIRDPDTFVIASALLISPFMFSAFVYELFTRSEQPFANIAYIMLGMLYIGVPFALLDFIAFNGDHFYAKTVFGLLLLTWMNDTGAYLVGSAIGKTPLLPRISPNKTWEGSIGGIIVTFATAVGLYFSLNELDLFDWLVLAAIVGVFASLGDLVESMLKRSYAAKDTGKIMPGHGGLLDRFDGFIFCIPYAAAYLLWLR